MPSTRLFGAVLCIILSLVTLIVATPGGGRGPGRDGGNSGLNTDAQATAITASTTNSTSTSTGTNATSALQGQMKCPGSQLMCVTGIVNGSTVTYELQSTGSQTLGWMAIGFGSQMANSPMVIMWPNTDGTITLSQREAPTQVMPTVVASPANVATVQPTLSKLAGSQPKLVFTIAGSVTQVPLVWAFGTTRPSQAADSTLLQHLDSGTFTLDLTQTLSSNSFNSSAPVFGAPEIPLLPYQKTIVAHAVVVTFGFLFLLPAGVLLARYTRTYYPRWFTGHWVIQAGIAGPFIIVGCILGFVAVNQQGAYVSSSHKRIGRTLLGLYIAQCLLGAFIHFVKVPFRFGRPPQNYFHALFGLAIIALALYQVHIGYGQEWPNTTGRPAVPNAVMIAWIVWAVLLTVLYAAGLTYLPRQWRQEHAKKVTVSHDDDSQSINRAQEGRLTNRAVHLTTHDRTA